MNKSANASVNSAGATTPNTSLVAQTAQNSTYQIQNVQNYIKELEISEGQLSSCIK